MLWEAYKRVLGHRKGGFLRGRMEFRGVCAHNNGFRNIYPAIPLRSAFFFYSLSFSPEGNQGVCRDGPQRNGFTVCVQLVSYNAINILYKT